MSNIQKTPIFFFLILFVLSFGCQSNPKLNTIPIGEKIEFHKITEKGIESISLKGSEDEWPEIQRGGITPFDMDSKNLKMIFVGDTGCRLKETEKFNIYQNCNDIKSWPFPKIAKKISAEKYDVLVHIGDYYYREACADKAVCEQYTNTTGPTWLTWWEDFYKPALPFLSKTPVVFMRGNHEDCKRGFRGWAPLSSQVKEFSESCDSYEDIQVIELSDIVFVNFDNSDFEDKKPLKPEEKEVWLARLVRLKDRIIKYSGAKEVWLFVHKPIYGFLPPALGKGKIIPASVQFRDLLRSVDGLESMIDVTVSGHIHSQQLMYFAEGKPQIIVANGGSKLDVMEEIIKNKDLYITTKTQDDFGYALFERKGFKKWNWQFKNAEGTLILDCRFENKKMSCK